MNGGGGGSRLQPHRPLRPGGHGGPEAVALARRLAAQLTQALRDTKWALNAIMSGTAHPGFHTALVAGAQLARFAG
ncbi:MAG TPA: hypothetical protein VHC18_24645 [Amycolatopsis sp.]|nr:hypothetical protein [Amycolatopsis sp.]